MKNGTTLPSEQVLMLRHIEVTGCTYPTTAGELAGVLLQIQAGPKAAPTQHRFFVSFESLQNLAELLAQAAKQGIHRTTPVPGPKH